MKGRLLIALLLGVSMMFLFACGKKQQQYQLKLDGYGLESSKTSYAEGEKVTVTFPAEYIGTDTDYSFTSDSEDVDLKRDYSGKKGYVMKFTMPAHDVTISVRASNSMSFDPTAIDYEEPEEGENTDKETDTTSVEAEPADPAPATEEKTLVVVFSATGNTKDVAEKIASLTGADLYEIKPAVEYTTEDLDWNDKNSRTTIEQNDPSSRPEIGSEPIDLTGYTRIFIGYPIWWAIEPRIMDTFVESYDFDGITMIPFCTSGSSSLGQSGKNLEKLAGSGNWQAGRRFKGGASENEVSKWLGTLE
ncbi:MAG: hypothetical protein J5487_00765 [Lachnospiraceae bacterium]|nr:hypothetical protein [Lachnospiraceae bacterium]